MSIPVIDFGARDAAVAIGAAARGPGFFLLTGHGVPEALRAEVFERAGAFFDLPAEAKAALSIEDNPFNRGWGRPGAETLDETGAEIDTKETYQIGYDLPPDDPRVRRGEPFRGPNPWPDLPGFREAMLEYFDAALALGVRVHRAFAADLGLAADHFDAALREPLATLRLLHYPPATGAEGEIGAGAHTDYGSITLLTTDGTGGLQVRPRAGDWTDVPHVAGAYVVNIGDCLMRWTNDIYVSTPHRVLPPARRRRSVAFFLDPDPGQVIAALPGTGAAKYPPVTAADYLRSRLDATYGAGGARGADGARGAGE